MTSTIQRINSLKENLTKILPINPIFQAKLDRKFRLEFNYNSNHIEGNTLTYGETELLIIFGKTQGNHDYREFEEMKAHDVAFKLIQDWAADNERPLTEIDLKLLHQTILVRPFWKEAITSDGQPTRRLIEIGNYKKHPNSVRLENGEIFEYASVIDTPMLMGDLMRWLREAEQNGNMHPAELAARLHYKFVRIHPFDDGNGRISRLVMNYILLKHGLPPVIIKSADKRQYLFALNQADTGNEAAFVDYIARQLIWSLELTLKAARGESIEEPDDIDKEIAIWKKQAAKTNDKLLQRNNFLIYELYEHTIRDMFKEFEEKHKQFYDLFHSSYFYEFKNNSAQEKNIWWLDEKIRATPNVMTSEDDFQNLWIQIHLQEYKFNQKNPFSLNFDLKFNFQLYTYSISYANSNRIEKSYGEFLDVNQKKQIITECTLFAFEQIKLKTKQHV